MSPSRWGKRTQPTGGACRMSSRRTPQVSGNRSAAWSSTAESGLPESATVRKHDRVQADDATEADIQASLSAALEELEQLESGAKPPRASQKMKIPRGMPPLPGGRAMPPLPFARVFSLHPRKSASAKPPVSNEVLLLPRSQPELPIAPAKRWPGIVAAVLGVLLLGAAIWLSVVRQ